MNSQKKRMKISKWVVTDIEEQNLNIPEAKVCGKLHTQAKQSKRQLGSVKRKIKEKGLSDLKKSTLQSFCNNNEAIEIAKNNAKATTYGIINIHEINRRNEPGNEMNNYGFAKKIVVLDEACGGSEIIAEQPKDNMKRKENSTLCGNDVENVMEKILHSDSDSVVSSLDLKDGSNSIADLYSNIGYGNKRNDKEPLTFWKMYKIKNEYKYILQLQQHSKFHFEGKLQITLLHGGIRIFGYTLLSGNEKNKSLAVYSPRRCMQMYITGVGEVYPVSRSNAVKLILEKYELEPCSMKDLHSVNEFDTFILIEKLFDKCSLALNHYCDSDLFLEKEITYSRDYEEKKLGCFLQKIDVFERRGFTQGYLWSKIRPKKCTIICGGKGVGKSTLFKFLINVKLTRSDAVLCIDLDPGQTEFTPPGCVCAVIRKQPLLGPNFTNITTPVKMAYIGSVNVASDPVKYMKAVNYVFKSCRQDPELSDLPWIVNTMGFNKGIGMDIVINIIKLLRPDKVVQINSSDKSRNFEITLSPELVQKQPVVSLVPIKSNKLKYELYKLKTCSKTRGIGFQGGYTSAEIREFMIISYFADAVSFPYCSLNAIQPRWVHFSKLCIAVSDLVQPNDILKAINGNLVGLCDIEGVDCDTKLIATTDSNSSFLKIAIQPEVMPCLGTGLVRGIDIEDQKIYIITPVSSADLEKVNCLYLGSISVPASFYLRQKYIDLQSVYTDVRGARNIRSVKPQFKYIPQSIKKNRND